MTSGRNRGPQQAAPPGQRETARAAAPSTAAAAAEPALLSTPASASADLLQLQRLIGNQAVGKPLATRAQRQARAASRSVVLSTREQAPAHTPAAPRGSLLQRLLVKAITARVAAPSSQAPRPVITDIAVEGRAPTTAAKGQGDHTVAETLLVQAIRGVCRLKGYWEAYNAVYTLMPTFAQENEIERYDAGALLAEFKLSSEEFHKRDSEDQLLTLETLIEHCIRAANKMAAAAFNRKEGFTTGGGGGSTEQEAIQYIRTMAKAGPLKMENVFQIAEKLVQLIDYHIFDEDFVDICARAVRWAGQSIPPLSNRLTLLVPAFAEAMVRARFGGKEKDALHLSSGIEKLLGMSQKPVSLGQVGLTGTGTSSASSSATGASFICSQSLSIHRVRHRRAGGSGWNYATAFRRLNRHGSSARLAWQWSGSPDDGLHRLVGGRGRCNGCRSGSAHATGTRPFGSTGASSERLRYCTDTCASSLQCASATARPIVYVIGRSAPGIADGDGPRTKSWNSCRSSERLRICCGGGANADAAAATTTAASESPADRLGRVAERLRSVCSQPVRGRLQAAAATAAAYAPSGLGAAADPGYRSCVQPGGAPTEQLCPKGIASVDCRIRPTTSCGCRNRHRLWWGTMSCPWGNARL